MRAVQQVSDERSVIMSYKSKREGGKRGPSGDQRPLVDADQIALLACPCSADALCFTRYETVRRLEKADRMQ
jgi:hypothetical protein